MTSPPTSPDDSLPGREAERLHRKSVGRTEHVLGDRLLEAMWAVPDRGRTWCAAVVEASSRRVPPGVCATAGCRRAGPWMRSSGRGPDTPAATFMVVSEGTVVGGTSFAFTGGPGHSVACGRSSYRVPVGDRGVAPASMSSSRYQGGAARPAPPNSTRRPAAEIATARYPGRGTGQRGDAGMSRPGHRGPGPGRSRSRPDREPGCRGPRRAAVRDQHREALLGEPLRGQVHAAGLHHPLRAGATRYGSTGAHRHILPTGLVPGRELAPAPCGSRNNACRPAVGTTEVTGSAEISARRGDLGGQGVSLQRPDDPAVVVDPWPRTTTGVVPPAAGAALDVLTLADPALKAVEVARLSRLDLGQAPA